MKPHKHTDIYTARDWHREKERRESWSSLGGGGPSHNVTQCGLGDFRYLPR